MVRPAVPVPSTAIFIQQYDRHPVRRLGSLLGGYRTSAYPRACPGTAPGGSLRTSGGHTWSAGSRAVVPDTPVRDVAMIRRRDGASRRVVLAGDSELWRPAEIGNTVGAMTYPDPPYFGDPARSLAPLPPGRHRRRCCRGPAAAPPATWRRARPPTGGLASTAGTWAPSPAARTPHFHRTISESFFMLSGTVRSSTAQWVNGTPGDFIYVPEGGLHGFRNESGEPASMLLLFTPGAPREPYFEGLVEMAEGRWKPWEEELQAFFEEHDNIYV